MAVSYKFDSMKSLGYIDVLKYHNAGIIMALYYVFLELCSK